MTQSIVCVHQCIQGATWQGRQIARVLQTAANTIVLEAPNKEWVHFFNYPASFRGNAKLLPYVNWFNANVEQF